MSHSLFRRYLSAAGYWLGSSVFARGIVFMSGVLLARLMKPSDYGMYVVLISIIAVTASFSNLKLEFGLLQSLPKFLLRPDATHRGLVGSTWKLSLVLGTLASIALFASGDAVSVEIYQRPELTTNLRIISPAVLFTVAFQMGIATLAGLQDFRTAGLVQVLAALLQLVATILGFLHRGFEGAILGYSFSTLAAAVIVFLAARSRLEGVGLGIGNAATWSPGQGRMLKVSLGFLLANLVSVSGLWCGNTILARLSGFEQAATFSVAYSIGVLTIFTPGYLLSPSLAFLCEAYSAGNVEEFRKLFRRNFQLTLTIAIPIAVFFASTSRQIPALIYGEHFAQAWLSAAFLSLAGIFWMGIAAFTQIFASTERVWEALILNAIWLGSFVGLSLISAPRWGAAGVALVFLASAGIAYGAYSWYGARAFGLNDPGPAKVALTTLVAGTLAVGLASYIQGFSIWFLGPGAALAALGTSWRNLYSTEERKRAWDLLGEFNGRLRAALSREGSK